MAQVLKLAEDMVLKRVMSNHAPLTHANKAMISLSFIVAILSFLGIGFIMAGLYIHLAKIMPLDQTLAVFGGATIVLSIIVAMIAIILEKAKQKKIQNTQDKVKNDIMYFFKTVDTELVNSDFVQNNPKALISLAGIIGYIAARQRF